MNNTLILTSITTHKRVRINVLRFKRFLAILFIASLVIITVFVLSKGLSDYNSRKAKLSSSNMVNYTVISNDTLWGISQPLSNKYELDINYVISYIKKINNLNSSDIIIGQSIKIPS